MSAFKGTPGPWVVTPCPLGRETGWMVGASDGYPDGVAVCNKRDAHLIAAAPELLEALKALFDRANHHTCTEIGGWFTGNDENFETLRKAEQAIAKATGERP